MLYLLQNNTPKSEHTREVGSESYLPCWSFGASPECCRLAWLAWEGNGVAVWGREATIWNLIHICKMAIDVCYISFAVSFDGSPSSVDVNIFENWTQIAFLSCSCHMLLLYSDTVFCFVYSCHTGMKTSISRTLGEYWLTRWDAITERRWRRCQVNLCKLLLQDKW